MSDGTMNAVERINRIRRGVGSHPLPIPPANVPQDAQDGVSPLLAPDTVTPAAFIPFPVDCFPPVVAGRLGG